MEMIDLLEKSRSLGSVSGANTDLKTTGLEDSTVLSPERTKVGFYLYRRGGSKMSKLNITKGYFPERQKVLKSVFILGLVILMIAGMMLNAIPGPALASAVYIKDKQPGAQAEAGAEMVIHWNTIALRTSIQLGGQSQPQAQIYLAPVQAAVYNAVVAIEGGYQPYRSEIALRPGASVEAAVATAAHAMLVYYFPNQQTLLDADLVASTAAIPDGPAKDAGFEVGLEAAAQMISLRQGAGLEADIGFSMPAPAPGVWQLPSGIGPLTPWISQLRPYLLDSPDQFRPSPPLSLSSREWAIQYEEVRLMGRVDSPYRTAVQTDIARFWTMHAPLQHNLAFQQFAIQRELGAVEAARLFAMGNLVGADALIACFDAKYHFLFWRPQFAIPLGDSDGNPATKGDPTWQPLLGTPNHPEYPSAHSCLTSGIAEVYAAFVGNQRIELDITSTAPNLMQPTRHYKLANDLVREIIDARVWGGIHYRESDIKGVNLGRKVAHWALQRNFLPVP
jgi:hypothetical protein